MLFGVSGLLLLLLLLFKGVSRMYNDNDNDNNNNRRLVTLAGVSRVYNLVYY